MRKVVYIIMSQLKHLPRVINMWTKRKKIIALITFLLFITLTITALLFKFYYDIYVAQPMPDQPYREVITALYKYQKSRWKDYDNPLIADSVLVTRPIWENSRPALYTGASYALYYLDELKLYYALLDINGDGLQELLIGSGEDYLSTFSIYSLQDGKAVVILQRFNLREHLYICDNGYIKNSSGFAPQTPNTGELACYTVAADGKLITEYFFNVSSENNRVNDPRIYTDLDGNVYTESQTNEIIARYETNIQSPDWRPLRNFGK